MRWVHAWHVHAFVANSENAPHPPFGHLPRGEKGMVDALGERAAVNMRDLERLCEWYAHSTTQGHSYEPEAPASEWPGNALAGASGS